jgi:hypothetical protein
LIGSSQLAAETDVARVAPEDFAILPWGGTPADKETLDDIYRCGFNLAGFVSPEGLDAVAAAKLKCIVSAHGLHVGDDAASLDDAEITRRVRAATEKTKQHPAVFAYYLRDEPSAAMFPTLGRYVAALREAAPEARPYINLFPIHASPQQQGTKDYEEHVESFVKLVKPRFISYDNYSLFDDGSVKDVFYRNLEVVRAKAMQHKLPFWNIVLGNAHFHYADPTEGGLRLQAFASVAYGARCLSYFTYFCPNIGNYRLAAIDPFGHKTPTWDMLRHVNLQLHRLAPTYVKLTSVNVFHHPKVPDGSQGIATSKHLAAVDGPGQYLVGEFDGPDGRPYVLIVNKDIHRSANFGVKFKAAGTILQTNSYTGGEQPWAGENVWLAPGQGMLLSVKK